MPPSSDLSPFLCPFTLIITRYFFSLSQDPLLFPSHYLITSMQWSCPVKASKAWLLFDFNYETIFTFSNSYRPGFPSPCLTERPSIANILSYPQLLIELLIFLPFSESVIKVFQQSLSVEALIEKEFPSGLSLLNYNMVQNIVIDNVTMLNLI